MPVNLAHSIGQHAVFVLKEAESHNEIINGTVPGSGGTTATVAGKLAFVPDTTYTTWARNTPELDAALGASFTVFWYGESVLLTTSLLASYTNGYGWRLELQGWDGGQSELWFVNHFTGGGDGGKASVRFSNSNTVRKFALRFDATDNTVDFCVDGSWIATNLAFNPGTNPVISTGNFALQNVSGTFSQRAKTITLQAFQGALSDADVAVLMADPDAIFAASAVDLSAAALAQANAASSGAIGITGSLNGAAAAQENTIAAAAITQVHALAGSNATQANHASSGTINPYTRLAAIIDPLPLHTWVKVNVNSFDDCTVPAADRMSDPGPHRSVIYAWASFAWDHAKAALVLFGGGHANYRGNEVYIWHGATGLWELGSLPSYIDMADSALLPVPSKDAPQSSHTYQNNIWLKNNRMLCTFGGAATPSGGPFQELVTADPRVIRRVGPWLFDLEKANPNRVGGATGTGWDTVDVKEGSQAWINRRDFVDGGYPIDTANHVNGAAVYADEDGIDVVYLTMDSASNLPNWYRYEFGNVRAGERDTFSQIGKRTENSIIADGWAAFDTNRGMMYRNAAPVSGFTNEIAAKDVYSAAWVADTPIHVVDELGAPFSMHVEPWPSCFFGCVYDAANDGLWLWDAGIEDATKPGRVWFISIPEYDAVTGWASTTWVATEINPTGDTPFGGHNSGVLGKIKHVPELGALVVLDGAQGANEPGVWMFKTTALNQTLVAAPAAQANTAAAAAITQAHQLSGAAAAQANTIAGAGVVLGVTVMLTALPAAQANTAAAAAITQAHQLSGAAAAQANTTAAAAITQAHQLSGAAAAQANTIAGAGIILGEAIILSVIGCEQANQLSAALISIRLTVDAPTGGGPRLRNAQVARRPHARQ